MEANEHAGGFNGPAPDKKSRENQALELYQKGVELAHSATTHDDHVKAIELFSMAISIRPNHARYFLARGNSFRSINEHESAVGDFTLAIELDGDCATYYANRGASYRKLGMTAEALEDLTIAIELDAKKGIHYFNRALVLYDSGYFREAINDFTKALADGSGGNSRIEFRALHSRGNCHRRMGNMKACVDDLLEAIKLEPRNPVGYNALAQCYMEASHLNARCFGDVESAIKHFTAAVNLQDTSATYLNNRGQALFRKGRESFRAALIDFHAAIKVDGKDAQAYYNRGITRLAIAFADIQKQEELEQTKKNKLLTVEVGDSDDESTAIRPVSFSPSPPVQDKEGTEEHEIDAQSVATTGIMSIDEQLEAAIADLDMACALVPTSTKYLFGKAMVVHLKQQPQEETFDLLSAALSLDSNHVRHSA